MPLNKPYQTQPSAIASYNFTDIVEGTGIVKFMAYSNKDSAGTNYNLTQQTTFYSSDIELSENNSTTSAILDKDFDLPAFNSPTTIRGTANVNVCFECDADIQSGTGYLIAKIRKWDGTTETEIASTQSESVTEGYAIFNLNITVPKTHFKKGEILRLTIYCNGTKTAGVNNFHVAFGCDPQNRDGTYIIPSTDDPVSTTKLEFYCPFDIDL